MCSLIGEHIDYVLFGCIPAAIEPDILIACGPSTSASTGTGGVHAHNLNPKYQPQNFVPMLKTGGPTAAEEAGAASTVHAEAAWQLDIDKRELRWESYVKAGYYVSLRFLCLDEPQCPFLAADVTLWSVLLASYAARPVLQQRTGERIRRRSSVYYIFPSSSYSVKSSGCLEPPLLPCLGIARKPSTC